MIQGDIIGGRIYIRGIDDNHSFKISHRFMHESLHLNMFFRAI